MFYNVECRIFGIRAGTTPFNQPLQFSKSKSNNIHQNTKIHKIIIKNQKFTSKKMLNLSTIYTILLYFTGVLLCILRKKLVEFLRIACFYWVFYGQFLKILTLMAWDFRLDHSGIYKKLVISVYTGCLNAGQYTLQAINIKRFKNSCP